MDPAKALGNLYASVAATVRANQSAALAQRLYAESESLVSWAREHQYFVEPEAFTAEVENLAELTEGNEHRVWQLSLPNAVRVKKQTKPPGFGARGTADAYLENLLRCNLLFADDIRLEGIVVYSEGIAILTSQPFILGREATEQEIADYFTRLEFVLCGVHHWRHQKYSVQIADARPANIIVSEENICFPIDVHILGTLPAEWLEETAPPDA